MLLHVLTILILYFNIIIAHLDILAFFSLLDTSLNMAEKDRNM